MRYGKELRAARSPWCLEPQVDFCFIEMAGDKAYLGKMTLDEVKDGIVATPTFSLPPNAAQMLMDELWNCGLRPSEGSGSAGQLASVQKHLEDMRAIAFKKSGVDKP